MPFSYQMADLPHLDTPESFQEAVRQGTVFLIDAYADLCGPCKQMVPYFDAAAAKLAPHGVACYKLNTDTAQELASALNVTSLPSFVLVEHGFVRDVVIGANRVKLEQMADTALAMMAHHASL